MTGIFSGPYFSVAEQSIQFSHIDFPIFLGVFVISCRVVHNSNLNLRACALHAEFRSLFLGFGIINDLELETTLTQSSRLVVYLICHLIKLLILRLERHAMNLEAALQRNGHVVNFIKAFYRRAAERIDLARRSKNLTFLGRNWLFGRSLLPLLLLTDSLQLPQFLSFCFPLLLSTHHSWSSWLSDRCGFGSLSCNH